jgi:hypothetical protein
MRHDQSLANLDDPGAGWEGLGAARPTADATGSAHDHPVAEVLVVISVRLEDVPQVAGLGEVCAHALVAGVAAGLDLRPRERQELDVGVVQRQQLVDVPSADRREAPADEFDVVRHCSRA